MHREDPEKTEGKLPDALIERLLEALDLPDGQREPAVRRLREDHSEHAAEIDRCLQAAASEEGLERLLTRYRSLLEDSASTPLDEPRPERIEPYAILDVLGRGGMGTVYLAEQREPVRRRVAIKVIRRGMDSAEILARFDLERRALAAMSHRSIAKVFDVGTTDNGQPYFAMELVQGLPLTDYCDRHRLSLKERIVLFQEICAGVQHAHQKGVIHRDLKPGNILVVREDDRAVPKILDFGLAKATNQELVQRTIYTERGRLMGTPEYMAPEQAAMAGETIDTRVDVYSLGVILYELLTGQLPFPSEQLRRGGWPEICRILSDVEPPRPSKRVSIGGGSGTGFAGTRRTTLPALRRTLRGDLDWIVLKALAKAPERRYDSAAGLAQDLQRHLDHEPVSAGPPSAVYRLRKLARRYRGQLVATTLVLSTAFVGMAVALQKEVEARELRRQTHEAELTTSLRRLAETEGDDRDMVLQMRRFAGAAARNLALLESWGIDVAGNTRIDQLAARIRAEPADVRRELVGALLLAVRHIGLSGLAEASIYNADPNALRRGELVSWREMARTHPQQTRAWPRLVALIDSVAESPATGPAVHAYADSVLRHDDADASALTVPGDAPAHEAYFCVWVGERMLDRSAAIDGYRRVVAAGPQNLWCHLRLARLLLIDAQDGERSTDERRVAARDGMAHAVAARALWPTSTTAANLVAHAWELNGEPERAAAILQDAIAHDDTHLANLFNLAQLAAAQGDRDRAIALLQVAHRLDKDDVEVWIVLGGQLRERAIELGGEVDDARRLLGHACDAAPTSWLAHYELALVEQTMGEHERALIRFDHALRLLPSLDTGTRAEVRLNRSESLAELGRLPAALEECIALVEEGQMATAAIELFDYFLNSLDESGAKERYRQAMRAARR